MTLILWCHVKLWVLLITGSERISKTVLPLMPAMNFVCLEMRTKKVKAPVTADAKNVEDRQQKCKKLVGRPRKSKPSHIDDDAKRKKPSSSAAAETVMVVERDHDDEEKDGVHRKKRRKKITVSSPSSSQAAVVGDEDKVRNETAKRRKPGRKKACTSSPVADTAMLVHDDDKPKAVTRRRNVKRKTTNH